MATEIWHNPKCSKSRTAKSLLDDTGAEYVERRYLDNPPSATEIRTVLGKLGLEPWDITRTGEPKPRNWASPHGVAPPPIATSGSKPWRLIRA